MHAVIIIIAVGRVPTRIRTIPQIAILVETETLVYVSIAIVVQSIADLIFWKNLIDAYFVVVFVASGVPQLALTLQCWCWSLEHLYAAIVCI
jgi:hypothetical protein